MQWQPTEEVREWHGATDEEDCFEMEARFKKQGLKIHRYLAVHIGNCVSVPEALQSEYEELVKA